MELDEFKQLAIQHGASTQYRVRELGTCFYVEWSIGGITGNSCWGREDIEIEADYPADCIPEFDKFLATVTPSLTFMQYKSLDTVITKDTISNTTDYYGNYHDYAYLGVSIEALYNRLVELKIPMITPKSSNSFGM